MSLPDTWARSGAAPLWVSVALYAVAHADRLGCVQLQPGQLRRDLAPDYSAESVSRAVKRAVAAGWLDPGSTGLLLRLARPVHHA